MCRHGSTAAPPAVAPAGPGATVHRITAEELAEAASARKQSRRRNRRGASGDHRDARPARARIVGVPRSEPAPDSARGGVPPVKRPLLTLARDKGPESRRQTLIMVTSALSGEGKTFCAINLAMSMAAEIDGSVLLVDADVVQPNLLQRLGVPPMPGLARSSRRSRPRAVAGRRRDQRAEAVDPVRRDAERHVDGAPGQRGDGAPPGVDGRGSPRSRRHLRRAALAAHQRSPGARLSGRPGRHGRRGGAGHRVRRSRRRSRSSKRVRS